MGEGILSARTAQHWFARFKEGNFTFDDLPHTGRPIEVDVDSFKELIESDPRQTTYCLAELLECNPTTVERHLKALEKIANE